MSYSEAFGILINSLAYAAGPIIGLVSAWVLFVFQEDRKQSFAAETARQSLIEELKWVESMLSLTVIKCAIQSDLLPRGIKEFRWFLKEGMARNVLEEIPAGILKDIDKTLAWSDDKIAPLLKFFRQDSRALELPISIIHSVLAAPTSAKLSAEEIKKLLDVRWQAHMLSGHASDMNEFFRLTFTVSDEENHKTIQQNNANSLRAYGRRAAFLLDRVRAALNELDRSRATT
jgi:hypothetical protein